MAQKQRTRHGLAPVERNCGQGLTRALEAHELGDKIGRGAGKTFGRAHAVVLGDHPIEPFAAIGKLDAKSARLCGIEPISPFLPQAGAIVRRQIDDGAAMPGIDAAAPEPRFLRGRIFLDFWRQQHRAQQPARQGRQQLRRHGCSPVERHRPAQGEPQFGKAKPASPDQLHGCDRPARVARKQAQHRLGLPADRKTVVPILLQRPEIRALGGLFPQAAIGFDDDFHRS